MNLVNAEFIRRDKERHISIRRRLERFMSREDLDWYANKMARTIIEDDKDAYHQTN